MRIAVTGGGSGGHALPALTVARALRERGDEVFAIGSREGVEGSLFRDDGFAYHAISTGKFRRYFDWRHFTDPFRVGAGFFQAWRILRVARPHRLFATGGFVSVPPVFAARILGIPVIIHEQTVSVGLANRLAARVAHTVCLAFPASAVFFPAGKVRVTGMPLRREMKEPVPWPASIPRRPDRSLVFVSGGAQGSRAINFALREALPALRERFDIVHQHGLKQEALAAPEGPGYYARPFFREEMPALMWEADLLVGRSGAGTVHDCAVTATPGLFIPLPHATRDEQTKNARWLAERGGAELLPEGELASGVLAARISELFDTGRVETMQRALAAHGDKDGTPALLAAIDEAGHDPRSLASSASD